MLRQRVGLTTTVAGRVALSCTYLLVSASFRSESAHSCDTGSSIASSACARTRPIHTEKCAHPEKKMNISLPFPVPDANRANSAGQALCTKHCCLPSFY